MTRPAPLLTILLALAAGPARAAAPHYRLTVLKPLPGYGASYATCLNDRGQVAGNLTSRQKQSGGRRRGPCAFLWTNGLMRLLPSLPSPYSSTHEVYDAVASGINNRGQVVGTLSYFFDGAWMGTDLQAVIWDRGQIQKIPRLMGPDQRTMNQNTAIAINDAGQVAGTADDDFIADSEEMFAHVYLFSGGRSMDLGAGRATGMNAGGAVCGYVLLNASGQPTSDSMNADLIRQTRAVLCQPDGSRLTLGRGYALNVNRSGNVVGTDEATVDVGGPPQLRTETTDALAASNLTTRKVFVRGNHTTEVIGPRKMGAARAAHVLLWRTGEGRSRAAPLPVRWLPQAINDTGWMVGGHWLWEWGREYDLNRLIGQSHGWKIRNATAINRRGQIAGWGEQGGRTRGFLLTPCI